MIITISREKQYSTAMRNNRFNWKYIYSWTADNDAHMQMLGKRLVDMGSHYGTDLGSLLDYLKRKYRGATITLEWAS